MPIRYRRADCTRYRTPPIDTSAAYRRIEALFLEAWQQGRTAQQVYAQVLADQQLTETLAAQVADNLGFQRVVAVHHVRTQTAEERKTYEAERRESLAAVTETVGETVATARAQYAETQQALQRGKDGYNAIAADLEGLRKRVSDKLSQVGGASGIEALVEINNALTNTPPPRAQPPAQTAYAPAAPTTAPIPTSTSPPSPYISAQPPAKKSTRLRKRSLLERFIRLFITWD